MKSTHRRLLVALLCGATSVQAQISVFSVSSYSDAGSAVQIAEVITSENALLIIESSPNVSFNNLDEFFPPYRSILQGAGGTILANTSGGLEYWTTTVTNQYAPDQGFNGTHPITSCTGRFFIEAPHWVWDDELYHEFGHYEGGTSATVQFTVDETHSFTLSTLAANSLPQFGLTGLDRPVFVLYNVTDGYSYIATFTGESNFDLGTLEPGTYRVYVSAETPAQPDASGSSGIVMVSINAN